MIHIAHYIHVRAYCAMMKGEVPGYSLSEVSPSCSQSNQHMLEMACMFTHNAVPVPID